MNPFPRLVALLALAWSAALSAAPARPDMFFFYADDWARIASCYANPKAPSLSDVIRTPNIDRPPYVESHPSGEPRKKKDRAAKKGRK